MNQKTGLYFSLSGLSFGVLALVALTLPSVQPMQTITQINSLMSAGWLFMLISLLCVIASIYRAKQ